jgi:hypothetical protein
MFTLRFTTRVVAGVLAACVIQQASASPITCRWKAKQQCDPGEACKTVPPAVWTIVDPQAKRYQRCDPRGCDTYEAVVTVGPGAFTVYELIGRGVFLKTGLGGSATEVVSLGNSVLVSHGVCR